MKDKIQNLKYLLIEIIKKFLIFFNKTSGDLSVFIGLCLINTATYKINTILGLILSGIIFIVLGYLINTNKRGDE